MIDCNHTLAALEAYLDGELSEGTRLEVEEHLSGCSPCFHRSEFRIQVKAIIRRKCLTEVEMPPALAQRIRRLVGPAD